MKRVYQPTKDTCLQAAIASVLELPLGDVPHFAVLKSGKDNLTWFTDLIAWAKKRGQGVVHFWTNDSKALIPTMHNVSVVAVGASKVCGEYEQHAVVCHTTTEGKTVSFSYAHDPAGRSADFLENIEHCFFFVPMRPKL